MLKASTEEEKLEMIEENYDEAGLLLLRYTYICINTECQSGLCICSCGLWRLVLHQKAAKSSAKKKNKKLKVLWKKRQLQQQVLYVFQLQLSKLLNTPVISFHRNHQGVREATGGRPGALHATW